MKQMIKASLLLSLVVLASPAVGVMAQDKPDQTVGQKVDSSVESAKKTLGEWEEKLKELDTKRKKLGKKASEEYARLKEEFLKEKEQAAARLKDLNERKGEIRKELNDQFQEAYQKAGKTFDKIKGLFGSKSEESH